MGRLGDSTACGALARCLELFKGGKQEEVREDGGLVLDPLDPELSILRQNLARLMQRCVRGRWGHLYVCCACLESDCAHVEWE